MSFQPCLSIIFINDLLAITSYYPVYFFVSTFKDATLMSYRHKNREKHALLSKVIQKTLLKPQKNNCHIRGTGDETISTKTKRKKYTVEIYQFCFAKILLNSLLDTCPIIARIPGVWHTKGELSFSANL